MGEITFHSMPDSAYLWAVMLVAHEKGVSHDFAPLEYGSPEHWALHPFGKMPVMRHGEIVLYESLAIAHYIDRAFRGPALQPLDALGQAETLRWVSIVNGYVFPTMNRFMKERIVRPAWGAEPDAAFLAAAREPLERQMQVIGDALAAHPFLVGERLTFADCFLLPHLLFFSLTPEGAALIAGQPAAQAWLERMTARDSYPASPMRAAFAFMREGRKPSANVWAAPAPA